MLFDPVEKLFSCRSTLILEKIFYSKEYFRFLLLPFRDSFRFSIEADFDVDIICLRFSYLSGQMSSRKLPILFADKTSKTTTVGKITAIDCVALKN